MWAIMESNSVFKEVACPTQSNIFQDMPECVGGCVGGYLMDEVCVGGFLKIDY